MPRIVAILEDDADRIAAMRAVLAAAFPDDEHAFFDDAPGMVVWLAEHLPAVALISLDHDLPFWRTPDNEPVDAGCGREVADYLAGLPPTCPVIVHSSNEPCAAGMMRVLRDGGWPTTRVTPSGEPGVWVADDWAAEIRRLAAAGWIT